MGEWLPVVKDVGFPIAVAVFVLVCLNGTVGRLKDAIVELTIELRTGRK